MRDQVPEDRGLHCLAVAGTPGFVVDLMYLLLASLLEVFHLRMGYPSISQYIPIKRLRRCWTIMAIAWIFASEWQTNAQSSEKPTCCDWTSPARDGCAMCWKCFPLCHENASMCEFIPRSQRFTPRVVDWYCWNDYYVQKTTINRDFQGFIMIYPSKPPPWSLLKWMIYWWYISLILHQSPDVPWVDLTAATHGTGLKECCLWFLSNGLPQNFPTQDAAMQVRAVRTLWICVS